jgi:hypothetical protein
LAAGHPPSSVTPAITIAIVTGSEHTLLVVADGDAVRHRSYAYGGAEVGNAEWMAGWAIGMAWLLLNHKPDPNPLRNMRP